MSRAVIITGGARRVGRQLALGFAKAGFDTFIHYNNSCADAYALREEINGLGRKCALFRADLRDVSVCRGLVDLAFKTFPYCDVLVNNASIFHRGGVAETKWQYLEENLRIHVVVPFEMSRCFIESCAKCVSRPSIINIVDAAVSKNKSSFFSYMLSKKSLADMTELMAHDGHNVRVHAVYPKVVLRDPENAKYYDSLGQGERVDIGQWVDSVIALVRE